MEWLEDVRLWEVQGYGASLNYEIAGPLLADLLRSLTVSLTVVGGQLVPFHQSVGCMYALASLGLKRVCAAWLPGCARGTMVCRGDVESIIALLACWSIPFASCSS